MNTNKRAYKAPTLVSYGSIAKLTQPGVTGDGGGGECPAIICIDINLPIITL